MKSFLIQLKPVNTDAGTLLLRIIFGAVFIYAGYFKLTHYSMILPMWKDYLGIGLTFSFNLVLWSELIGGTMVVIGLLTRLAVIPLFIIMIVVCFIAMASKPLTEKEFEIFLLLASLVIFNAGSGKYAVDAILQRKH